MAILEYDQVRPGRAPKRPLGDDGSRWDPVHLRKLSDASKRSNLGVS